MPDYKFVFTKKAEIVIEAATEDAAWMQVSQLNPDFLGAEWEIENQTNMTPKEIPLDEGPVEIDDWDQFNQF
jgi:hypothetical protein